jgi:LysR family transcriptional regulator, transcription activator of glutamate synthase operon
LNELKGNPFILSPKGYVLRDLVMKACKLHGFEPEVAFEGKDTDAIKGLVGAGLGITLIPEISLIDSLPRFTVKLPLEEPSVNRTVGVIVPTDRELMPTEKLFYQFLRGTFATLEGFQ